MNPNAPAFVPSGWLPAEHAHFLHLTPQEQQRVHESMQALQALQQLPHAGARTPRIAALAAGLPPKLLNHVLQRLASASPAEAAKVSRWACLVADVCGHRPRVHTRIGKVRSVLQRVRKAMDDSIVGQELSLIHI